MDEGKNYWFPARPPEYGWGWGLPIRWQGWAVYAIFFVLLIGGVLVLARLRHPSLIGFWGVLVGAMLIGVCAWKGEPPGPFFGRTQGNPRQKPRIK